MASDVICVDLDFSLIRYRQPAFTELQYLSMARGMVQMGYSEQLLEREWMDQALEFTQNGLVADLKRGNVMSLGKDGQVRNCYYGFKRINEEEVHEMYGNPPFFPIGSSYKVSSHYWIFLTHFATAESAIYQACAHSLSLGLTPLKSISTLEADLYLCACQRFYKTCPYSFIPELYQHPEIYIEKEGELVEVIRQLGRPVVIVTNSHEEHVNTLCEYALGQGWRGLFDLVVLAAGKPGYFEEGSEGSYTESGMMVGGSYRDLEARYPGKTFTYIGDHFVNDVSAPHKALNWPAVALLPELETESTSSPPAYFPHYGLFVHPENYWIGLISDHAYAQFKCFEAFLRSIST